MAHKGDMDLDIQQFEKDLYLIRDLTTITEVSEING